STAGVNATFTDRRTPPKSTFARLSGWRSTTCAGMPRHMSPACPRARAGASRESRTATGGGTDAACGPPGQGWGMASILPRGDLDSLFAALRSRGYRIVGPTVRDGSIVHGELESAGDLPAGWTDEQAPARYRLTHRDDDALFGHAVGPQSWKAELLPPRVRLWQAQRDGLAVQESESDAVPTAF